LQHGRRIDQMVRTRPELFQQLGHIRSVQKIGE
jgi:hypothetical protein